MIRSLKPAALFVALGLACVVTSCTDAPITQPPANAGADDASAVSTLVRAQSVRGGVGASSRRARGLDAEFARIAREVRGFGGMFMDDAGRLNVYLTDPDASEGEVRSALARAGAPGRAFRSASTLAATEVVVHQGRYDFLELAEWHDRMLPILGLEGVVFTHVDETRNRLGIGVEAGVSRTTVDAGLEALGVPVEAVVTVPSRGISPLVGNTLRDVQRPRAGGPQITFRDTDGAWFLCTLGFNILRADEAGRSAPEFITNSHCSAVSGQVTGTGYYQALPEVLGGHAREFIGTELVDPALFASPCFEGFVCRWSDALIAGYDHRSPVSLGSIFRTSFFGEGTSSGSIEVGGRGGRLFRIRGEAPFPQLGEVLNKVGRTTGWTRGKVVLTCAHFEVVDVDPPTAMLCQDAVAAASAGGDSGSPVFSQIGSSDNIELSGLLWGGGTIGGEEIFVFSAMENIHLDLGAFTTH